MSCREKDDDIQPTAVEDGDIKNQAQSPLESEQMLLRKIDIRLIPIIFLLYLMAFLDRINVSNALTLGLQKRLHLHGNEVNVALCIFYIPYVILEIPSNLALKKIKPNVWLSGSLVLFGIVTICHGFVENYNALLTVRFLLGLAESGVLPGCSYLLSMWYRPEEALKRYAIFFNSVTLAGAFGSLLASGIDFMDGIQHRAGWQWIFILEGLATVVVGAIAFFAIPNFPQQANWMSPAERQLMQDRVQLTDNDPLDDISLKSHFAIYFSDYKSYIAAFLYFGGNTAGYSVGYFLPTIIRSFHYSTIQSQLYSVPPFAAAWAFSMLLSYTSAYLRHSFGFILFTAALALSGSAVLLNVHTNVHVMYAATFLITAGVFGSAPIAIMWYVMNLRGHTQRALGTAFMIGCGNIGGIVATFSFQTGDAPAYHQGYIIITFATALFGSAAIAYACKLYIEVKEKELRRIWQISL